MALLVFLLVYLVYFIFKRFRNFPGVGKILCFAFFFTAVCLLWFGQEIMENGLWFLKEFLAVQADLFLHPVASHGEPFYYHFVVVFIGCFPISIIALPVFFSKNEGVNADFSRIMKILFWTVMILFSLSTTKIVHYSSLTYMPLAFLAAVYLDKILESDLKMKKWMLALIVFMGFVFSFLLAALPYVANHHELILPYLKDPFAAASLNVPVNWSGFESLTGVGYFVCVYYCGVTFFKEKKPGGYCGFILFNSGLPFYLFNFCGA